MKKFMSSVGFAARGIRYAWATERNFKVQLSIFLLVMLAGIFLQIPKNEFLIILLISAVQLSLELSNTAIERLADRVSPEYGEQIGVVKDLMAGAVLVSSIFAIAIGCYIFSTPLLKYFQF